jgi:outer membrane protein OmpA-like peptidoglycan-associated protein
MRTRTFKWSMPALLVAAAFAGGCAHHSERVAAVDAAQQSYHSAAADPRVNRYAATELGRARSTLVLAESEARDSGDSMATNHLAYLARQRAAIATEIAAQREADDRIRVTGLDRERALLQARTAEADRAQQQAYAATIEADAARRDALNAQSQADMERQRAAKLEADLAALQATKTDRGMTITLQDVVFDSGSAQLKPGAMLTLDRLAEVLRANPERRVQIEGFTDSQGGDAYNLDLASRRAAAVRQALTSRGVSIDRIDALAYGEAYPVATNDTSAGRQLNRRVEIVFSDTQGNVAARSGGSGSIGSTSSY